MTIDVERCSLSNLRERINDIISIVKEPPTEIYAHIYQADSIRDLEIQSGISFRAGEVLNFLTSVGFNRREFKTNAFSFIRIEHFSIDVDYENCNGPFNILRDDVSLTDVKNSISKTDIPLFVSSCKVGKEIIISIQTKLTYEELKAELNISGIFIPDVRFFIQKLSTLSDVNATLMIRGGHCASILNNDQEHANQAIQEFFDTKNGFGKILSYSLSNLYDNSPFGYPKLNNNITVTLLYVVPNSSLKKYIDFSFVDQYREEEFSINLLIKKESEFQSLLFNNDEFLYTIDILMLGGVDGKNRYSIFDENMVTILDNWRNSRGFIIFLHDFITEKQKILFNHIIQDLGFVDVSNTKSILKKL